MVLAAALVGAGCGGDSAEDADPTPSGTIEAPISGTTAPNVEIPDVVGLRLDEAIEQIEELGLGFQAITETRQVEGGHDWEVCRVGPAPGTSVPANVRVEVLVARPGRCE